eukprot:3890064-Rhodomonas_salina.1
MRAESTNKAGPQKRGIVCEKREERGVLWTRERERKLGCARAQLPRILRSQELRTRAPHGQHPSCLKGRVCGGKAKGRGVGVMREEAKEEG